MTNTHIAVTPTDLAACPCFNLVITYCEVNSSFMLIMVAQIVTTRHT